MDTSHVRGWRVLGRRLALTLALVVGGVGLTAAPAAAADPPVAPCIYIDSALHCGKTHPLLPPPCAYCPWVMPLRPDIVLPPAFDDRLGALLVAGLDALPEQGAMSNFDAAVAVLGNSTLRVEPVGYLDVLTGTIVPYANTALESRARHLAAGVSLLQRGLRTQAWGEFLLSVDDGTPLPA
jgi:hypothetical protein